MARHQEAGYSSTITDEAACKGDRTAAQHQAAGFSLSTVNDPKSCGRGLIPRGWRSWDLPKIKYGEFPPIPAWWLKQTSTPRCFAKGDTKYYIPLPCGCRSNNAPVQASELYTALHTEMKQRGIKENLRYHESAVLNVQDGRYSHRIGKEWETSFADTQWNILLSRQNVETDFCTPLFYKKRFAENGRLLLFCRSFMSNVISASRTGF